MTTIEYQQAAIRAIAAALHGDACPADPDPGESCGCGDYERESEIALTTAAPHIRADERRRVAEEIRARIDSAEDEHPFVEGVNAGFEYAARIAEGGAE